MPFQERQADLWSGIKSGNAVVVTTNTVLTKYGDAIMGRGTALQAKERFPGIEKRLGQMMKSHPDECKVLGMGYWELVAFPTKHHWRRGSDLDLITKSAEQLAKLANLWEWNEVYMPRPGIGYGGLNWLDVVFSGALDCLDERFIVVYQ